MEKKKLLLVSLGHLSCDVNGGALPAALPYISAARHFDYQAAGGLILAYSCLSSLIQPLLGFLADKHQKPWFIPLGVLLAGCGIATIGFWSNYWAIFAGITVSGIGSAFFHPEGARFANRISGSHKGTGMSVFSIGGNSGFIAGPLLVTVFIGLFGLQGMAGFGMIGAVMAIILFMGVASLPGLTIKRNDVRKSNFTSANTSMASDSGQKNNWKGFFRLVPVIICRSIVFTGCNTFIPLYWVNVFHQSRAVGAIALMIFGTCGIICNFLGGLMTDRFGSVAIIRTAFFLMFPVLFVFSLLGSIWGAWLMLPLLGLTLYLPFSAQVILGQSLLGKNVGFASGVTLGLATTLGGIAQPCLGWIADSWGLSLIFTCLSAIALLGSLLTLRLIKA